MTDKTCGSCGQYMTYCGKTGCWVSTDDNDEYFATHTQTETCTDWTTSDSVEQVALDMLDELRYAEAQMFPPNWVGRITDVYFNRLSALGVEVEG